MSQSIGEYQKLLDSIWTQYVQLINHLEEFEQSYNIDSLSPSDVDSLNRPKIYSKGELITYLKMLLENKYKPNDIQNMLTQWLQQENQEIQTYQQFILDNAEIEEVDDEEDEEDEDIENSFDEANDQVHKEENQQSNNDNTEDDYYYNENQNTNANNEIIQNKNKIQEDNNKLIDEMCQTFEISKKELLAIKKLFDSYDIDHNGTIDPQELTSLLNDLELQYTEIQMKIIFSEIDTNANNKIEFNEFVKWWVSGNTFLNNKIDNNELILTKKDKTEISKNLFIYNFRYENIKKTKTLFRYYLECAKFNKISFRISFEGSKNILMDNQSDNLIKEVNCDAFQRIIVAEVTQNDPKKGWSLKSSYQWKELPPNLKVIMHQIEYEQTKIENLLENEEKFEKMEYIYPSNIPLKDLIELYEIKSNAPDHFIDLDFPPLSSSVGNSFYTKKDFCVHFRRATEFCENPQIFELNNTTKSLNSIEPNDIRQGYLGDCWFLSALASLAEFPFLIEKLFISKQFSSIGTVQIQLFKNGRWHVITVDDYFPCFPEAGPIFSRSVGDEFWVLLIEKAYAKFHGKYECLKSGWEIDGLIDLTGYPAQTIRLNDSKTKIDISNGNLWNDLMKWDQNGCLICCATSGNDEMSETNHNTKESGLVPGHAYTLLNAIQVNNNRILRVRNPWGSFEWGGEFSDKDNRWNDMVFKKEVSRLCNIPLENVIQEDDGTFWMSYDDWLQNFVNFTICYVKSSKGDLWQQQSATGFFWSNGENEPIAPMFELNVLEDSDVYISLHQIDERIFNSPKNIDIGLSIVRQVNNKIELIGYSAMSVDRQIQTNEIHLVAGTYSIVPLTSGCRLRPTGNTNKSNNSNKMEWDDDKMKAIAQELICRFDQDLDDTLNLNEFSNFLNWAIYQSDSSISNKLQHSKNLYQSFFSQSNLNQKYQPKGITSRQLLNWLRRSDYQTILSNLGYSLEYQLMSVRPFSIVVHSTGSIHLEETALNPQIREEAIELPIKLHGKLHPYKDAGFNIYTLQGGYYGVSIAVENIRERPINVKMDCSKSTNTTSHRGSLIANVSIQPHKTQVMHHLSPLNSGPWTWSYSCAFT